MGKDENTVTEFFTNLWNSITAYFTAFNVFTSLIDILLVAFTVYSLIKLIRDSRAEQLIKGLLLLFIAFGAAKLLDLRAVTFLLQILFDNGLLILVVIFQPEIRRALEQAGHSRLGEIDLFGGGEQRAEAVRVWKRTIDAVCGAVELLRAQKMGALIKMLKVPVVTIITKGAFAYDPLYNCLQKRKVKTSAHVKCLFTAEEVASLSTEELSAKLEADFTFDNFKWQQENSVKITEPFRADGLHRILYKCPHCLKEGEMVGKGERITCNACGKTYLLTEDGLPKKYTFAAATTECSVLQNKYSEPKCGHSFFHDSFKLNSKTQSGYDSNYINSSSL